MSQIKRKINKAVRHTIKKYEKELDRLKYDPDSLDTMRTNSPDDCSYCIEFYTYKKLSNIDCSDCPMAIPEKGDCMNYPDMIIIEDFLENYEEDTSVDVKDYKKALKRRIAFHQRIFENDGKVTDSHSQRDRIKLKPSKICPVNRKILPIIRRNGFKTSMYNLVPHELFSKIIKNPISETLIKARQTKWLRLSVIGNEKLHTYWHCVKIALRYNYKMSDIHDWLDYLYLLDFFNKDLYNPQLICPGDLKKEHDRYVVKKREFDRNKNLEDLKRQITKDQKLYSKQKKPYMKLKFVDKDLVIEPMKTVRQFLIEGDILNHCLFANEYHKEKHSLIMSAKLKGKPIETVEVCLKDFEIVQARGFGNIKSKHNKQIIKLVNNNMRQIAVIK